MNASERGSNDWWAVVLTMPDSEAKIHLEAYKIDLVKRIETHGNEMWVQNDLTRVNAKAREINIRFNSVNWQKACKNILTPEMFDAVASEKIRLEEVAR